METTLYVFEWKKEPESPPRSIYEDSENLFSATDLTAFDAECEVLIENHNENKAEVVTKLLEDLDHLGQLDEFIKEGKVFFLFNCYCTNLDMKVGYIAGHDRW